MGERSGLARIGKEACVKGTDRRGLRACVSARVCLCVCGEEVQKQRLNKLVRQYG